MESTLSLMMRERRRLSLDKRGNIRVGSLFDQCCICGSNVAQKLLPMHVNECLERSEERESLGERWKEGKKRNREEEREEKGEKGKLCREGEGEGEGEVEGEGEGEGQRSMEEREELMFEISEETDRGRNLVEMERQFEDCKAKEGECGRENQNEKRIKSFGEVLKKSSTVLATQHASNSFVSGETFSKCQVLRLFNNESHPLPLKKSRDFSDFSDNKVGMESGKSFLDTKKFSKIMVGDTEKYKLLSETCDTSCKFENNGECTANCGFRETHVVGETMDRKSTPSETELSSISSLRRENCFLKDSKFHSSLLVGHNVNFLSEQDQISTPISIISIKDNFSDSNRTHKLAIKDKFSDFQIINGQSSTSSAFQTSSNSHFPPFDPIQKTSKPLKKEIGILDSHTKENASNFHFIIDPFDLPPKPINLLLSNQITQSRISIRGGGLTKDLEEERKFSVRVLQPGMVVFQNRISLDEQQRMVEEAQKVAGSFHRPSTGGGRKYHIYSTCWGSRWDGKSLRYVSDPKGSPPLPDWLLKLAQNLAREANGYTSVLPAGTPFEPDIGLINYYPVKAEELGIIGLGGHQDLDDTCHMPVVSVSIGDSMTFFYRRLPPLSRRKSGVMVSVNRDSEKGCEEGDASYNREHTIILGSGDVLVFGGESRLVYHGTRNLQSATKPPKLKMALGRLNFTFRKHD